MLSRPRADPSSIGEAGGRGAGGAGEAVIDVAKCGLPWSLAQAVTQPTILGNEELTNHQAPALTSHSEDPSACGAVQIWELDDVRNRI